MNHGLSQRLINALEKSGHEKHSRYILTPLYIQAIISETNARKFKQALKKVCKAEEALVLAQEFLSENDYTSYAEMIEEVKRSVTLASSIR